MAVLTAARKELAEPAVPVAATPRRARGVSLSTQTRSTQIRSRANTVSSSPMPPHGRGSSATPDECTPIETVLRSLAISLPAADRHLADEPDADVGAQTLVRALAERSLKADDVTRATQQAFERSIASHVADAATSVQVLRDSVLAESPFGPGPAAGLVDPGIEASLEVLGEEAAKVSDSVAAAERDLDAGLLAMSERRDYFVKRWGRE